MSRATYKMNQNPAHVSRDEFGERLKEFDRLKTAPFERKLELAKSVIGEHLDGCSDCAVACSFGKDSTVLTHLILQVNPDIPVVFLQHGR